MINSPFTGKNTSHNTLLEDSMENKTRTACLAVISVFLIILILTAAVKRFRTVEKEIPDKTAFYTVSLDGDEISITNASGETVKTGLIVKYLPKRDITALRSGINVDSYEKVLTLMENYSS